MLSMYEVGDSIPNPPMCGCSVSSGEESGSGCRVVNAVVGEKGLMSRRIDEIWLNVVNDNDIDDFASCTW